MIDKTVEIHETSVKPSKSHQNEDNQKVRILRKRVRCKKRNAEVLLRAMSDQGDGITQSHSEEPLDYISGEEVMKIYKVKKSWLYTSAK